MSAAPRPTLVDSRRQFFWGEHELIDYGVPAHIGTSAWTIYTCLLRHVNSESVTFPSVPLLMAESGLSNRVVAKSIGVLKQVGLIEVDRQSHQWNVYRVLDALQAIRRNGWVSIKEARDEKSPAAVSGQKQVTKGHKPRDEKSPEQVTKSHAKKNQLKTTKEEGGEYKLEGDAHAETPAAPVVEPTPAPITTSIAARENQGGQTPPMPGGQTDTAAGVAVVSPDGEAAGAAITDAELEFLFGDQAPATQETGTITEVQEVPGGAAARPGAQEGQEGPSAPDLGPHDPEETRGLLVPALGGQKKLSALMEETPPGLTFGARRGWITRITPERAAQVIAAARVEAGADNPWTYIIRHLDMELGAQVKRGGSQSSGAPTVTPNGASLHAAVRMEVVPDVAPTDVYAVGARWQARDSGEIATITRTSLSPVRNGKITLYHLSNGQDLKAFELMGRYDHIGADE